MVLRRQRIKMTVKKPLVEKSGGFFGDDQEKKWNSKLQGILLSLFSCFALLILNTIVQKMKLHFSDVLLVRAVLQSCVGLFFAQLKGESVWIKKVDAGKSINKMRSLLFIYGLLGALLYTTDLIAISFMPLGDAMTIIMSSVLPTIILAAIFLKERLRLYQIFCAILVVTGIVLVLRPPLLFGNSGVQEMQPGFNISILLIANKTSSEKFESSPKLNRSHFNNYVKGAFAALTCMFSIAASRTVMKMLVKNKSTSSFTVPLVYESLANLIVAIVLPAFGGNQRILFSSIDVKNYDGWQWVGLFSVAIIGVTQYATRFMAIKLISPTLISFIRTSEIIMAYVIQLTILGTEPYTTSLIGSGIVMVACIAIIFEEWAMQKLYSKFQFLF